MTVARTLGQKVHHYLPYFNLLVGSTALTFQVTVLYPWHNELDREFKLLKAELKTALADTGSSLHSSLVALEAKVNKHHPN